MLNSKRFLLKIFVIIYFLAMLSPVEAKHENTKGIKRPAKLLLKWIHRRVAKLPDIVVKVKSDIQTEFENLGINVYLRKAVLKMRTLTRYILKRSLVYIEQLEQYEQHEDVCHIKKGSG